MMHRIKPLTLAEPVCRSLCYFYLTIQPTCCASNHKFEAKPQECPPTQVSPNSSFVLSLSVANGNLFCSAIDLAWLWNKKDTHFSLSQMERTHNKNLTFEKVKLQWIFMKAIKFHFKLYQMHTSRALSVCNLFDSSLDLVVPFLRNQNRLPPTRG